jgi:hypothetical protein
VVLVVVALTAVLVADQALMADQMAVRVPQAQIMVAVVVCEGQVAAVVVMELQGEQAFTLGEQGEKLLT